jgi:hypothetical protein
MVHSKYDIDEPNVSQIPPLEPSLFYQQRKI